MGTGAYDDDVQLSTSAQNCPRALRGLASAQRNASCAAIDDVEVGILTRAAIGRLIEQHPAVGAKLLVKITQLLAQRLRNTSAQLVKAVVEGKQRALF